MHNKRLIFTLLYADGAFFLSRNFRLQRVGDLRWLQSNYKFNLVSGAIDELVVLDVSRAPRDNAAFGEVLKKVTSDCFLPVAAGGGVRTIDHARTLLRSGADKIVLNTPLFQEIGLVESLAREFGRQCIIGSIDIDSRISEGHIVTDSGRTTVGGDVRSALASVLRLPIGELYLNSVSRDGTGQGFEFELLDLLPPEVSIPVILAGGAGNASHLLACLQREAIDAAATANLFNFVGNGLRLARERLIAEGVPLAMW